MRNRNTIQKMFRELWDIVWWIRSIVHETLTFVTQQQESNTKENELYEAYGGLIWAYTEDPIAKTSLLKLDGSEIAQYAYDDGKVIGWYIDGTAYNRQGFEKILCVKCQPKFHQHKRILRLCLDL